MLIKLRDNDEQLVVKDILDIDFDMSVFQKDGKYCVKINAKYRLDEQFDNQEDAESQMLMVTDTRNKEEAELEALS